MLNRDRLLDAFSGVRDEDILASGQALGLLPRRARRNVWRPLLIAAVLTALLTATAVAAGLLGRAERIAPMPPDPSGEQRQAAIPNGFRGTPTYQGSAEWWTYMARWVDLHGSVPESYDRRFVEKDLEKYLVCGLYRAFDREQAETLYGIAGKYDLSLCREQVYFSNLEEFYRLTGAGHFTSAKDLRCDNGYVLEDGSFDGWFSFREGHIGRSFRLRRYLAGSIFPFGGAAPAREYREEEYTTARGDQVFLDIFSPARGEITYVDPSGQIYITLEPQFTGTRDIGAVCRETADRVNFEALCRLDPGPVGEILNQPTGAEENPGAVEALERFENSPMFRAAKEFGRFYQENFYGNCFTGTYGLESYEDIDHQLETLGKTYGLHYAREKATEGGRSRPRQIVFDNGAWQRTLGWGNSILHYIPRDALYTMLPQILDTAAYRRVWNYRTQAGVDLVLFAQAQEDSPGSFALRETADAWILLGMNSRIPGIMEEKAEAIDWAGIGPTGGMTK